MGSEPEPASHPGPTYYVNLEGVIKPWEKPEITVAEIRDLAGWNSSQPVVEVNLEENTEKTLTDNETVTLKPGHGFEKKVEFKRGS